jgi:AMMECR1 domain-containing protein
LPNVPGEEVKSNSSSSVADDKSHQMLREDTKKFVELARYSLLPHVKRREVTELPEIMKEADGLFKRQHTPGNSNSPI